MEEIKRYPQVLINVPGPYAVQDKKNLIASEIFRSSMRGIPNGQREAARVLGYNHTQTFFKIIFPQMCKRVLPPVTNEVITLVKDTSLAFVLAYTEMFTIAKQVAAAQANILPLFVAGVFYGILQTWWWPG